MSITHILETAHPMSIGVAPLLWYDTDDLNTITLNSGNVSQLDDKGSAGVDLFQSTVGLQPVYNNQQINGRPTIEFDGVDDVLESNSTSLLPSGNPAFTAFCVLKLNTTAFGQRPWGWGISGVSNSAHLAILDLPPSRYLFSFFGNSFVINSPLGTTSPVLITWKYDGNISTTFINNAATTPATFNHPVLPSIPTPTTFLLGRFLSTMDGVIGEYILYDRALAQLQSDIVDDYLALKWGI